MYMPLFVLVAVTWPPRKELQREFVSKMFLIRIETYNRGKGMPTIGQELSRVAAKQHFKKFVKHEILTKLF